MNADLEQAIDQIASTGCGQCGRSLPKPGVRCQCGAFPDVTREEAARELAAPGELSLHRADGAERTALGVMFQFVDATRAPDRLRKLAELEAEAAEVQDALAEAVAARQAAVQALAGAEAAEAEVLEPLEACRGLAAQAAAKLEEIERTCQDDEAEWHARIAIAELYPIFERRQRAYDAAATVTTSKRLDLEQAELQVALCERARDEDATARLHLDEVRPSAERLILLARPLTEYFTELLDDRQSGDPQYSDEEWANMLGLLYQLAGAAGLLALAEDGATPRVLADLAGPLSRVQDVLGMQRRIAASHPHLSLPPGPGEGSMSLLGNQLH